MEDRRDGLADRLALTSSQLAGAHTSLEAADGGREAMVLCMFQSQLFYGSFKKYLMQISRADTVGDRVEELERLVAEAKAEAQEADKRCEDVVR